MATYYRNTNQLKRCPYFPSHMVSATKYQNHITKCKMDYERLKKPEDRILITCPHNASHIIEKSQMEKHLSRECADARGAYIRSIQEEEYKDLNVVPPSTKTTGSEEVWDGGKEYVLPAFDKKKKQEDSKDFKQKDQISVALMKPYERREYYQKLNAQTKAAQRASERSEPTSEDNEFVPSASVPRQDPSQIKQPTEKPFNKIVGGIGRGRSRSTNSIPDSVDNISRYSPY